MSRWNHTICDDCWQKKHPGKAAGRVLVFKCETCCFCGNPTVSGIWIRHDPKDEKLACKGSEHEEASTS